MNKKRQSIFHVFAALIFNIVCLFADMWRKSSYGGVSDGSSLRNSGRGQAVGLLRTTRLLHHHHGKARALQGPL